MVYSGESRSPSQNSSSLIDFSTRGLSPDAGSRSLAAGCGTFRSTRGGGGAFAGLGSGRVEWAPEGAKPRWGAHRHRDVSGARLARVRHAPGPNGPTSPEDAAFLPRSPASFARLVRPRSPRTSEHGSTRGRRARRHRPSTSRDRADPRNRTPSKRMTFPRDPGCPRARRRRSNRPNTARRCAGRRPWRSARAGASMVGGRGRRR